jgi:hypothetical protein
MFYNVDMYIFIYLYVYIYLYTYIYIYIHIYESIYIQINESMRDLSGMSAHLQMPKGKSYI